MASFLFSVLSQIQICIKNLLRWQLIHIRSDTEMAFLYQ